MLVVATVIDNWWGEQFKVTRVYSTGTARTPEGRMVSHTSGVRAVDGRVQAS